MKIKKIPQGITISLFPNFSERYADTLKDGNRRIFFKSVSRETK